MAKSKNKKTNVDFSRFANQFKNLDTSNPASWPAAPKALMLLALAALIVAVLWFVWLKGVKEEWDASIAQEDTLKKQYTEKLKKAINLDALIKQREQVQTLALSRSQALALTAQPCIHVAQGYRIHMRGAEEQLQALGAAVEFRCDGIESGP